MFFKKHFDDMMFMFNYGLALQFLRDICYMPNVPISSEHTKGALACVGALAILNVLGRATIVTIFANHVPT